jgi:hypothetical protein
MKRLLALEFNRLLRQKSAIIIGILIVLISLSQVGVAQATAYEDFMGNTQYFFTARSIIESSFQLGNFQILLIGVITSLFIATDITQGTIRNKLIAGYSKMEVYLTQMILSISITILGLVLYHLLPLLFSGVITFPITEEDSGSLANFLIHVGFGYLLVIVGVVLTTWIAMKAKSTAGATIFTLLIFILGPTLMVIAKSVAEGILLANIDQFTDFELFEATQRQINEIFEWIYFYQIQRLNGPVSLFELIFGEPGINFFAEETQSYIVKTLISSFVLLGLLIGVGGWRFSKSDLR